MVLKEFIEKIISDIGPRPAGSENELMAGEIVAREFQKCDAGITFHNATTRPDYIHNLINLMTLTYGIAILLYLILPAAAAGLIAVMLLVLYLTKLRGPSVIHWLFKKAPTRSVVAHFPASGIGRNTLIFSGHHDSPYNMPLFYSSFKPYVLYIESAAAFGAAMLVPAGILRSVNPGDGLGWYDLFFCVSLLGFAVTLFFRFTMVSKIRNLGANDNLSSVAVLLGIADKLKTRRPENTDIYLISFGAEEPDLAGSSAFAGDHAELVRNAVHVNMETVGAGMIAVMTGEKASGVQYTPDVVNLIMKAGGRLGLTMPAVKIGYGATDSSSLVKMGGRSACLFGMDETGLFSLWHSPDDRPENIIEENLQKALNICLEIVALSEEEKL